MKNVNDELKMYTTSFESKLNERLVEAKKNPVIKRVIDEQSIPDEVAMKYVSDLKLAYEEQLKCEKCKGLDFCKTSAVGFYPKAIYRENSVELVYLPCRYNAAFLDQQRRSRFIFAHDIPEDILEAKISDVTLYNVEKKRVLEKVIQFIKNYQVDHKQKGLFIYGSFGVGKTYLLAAMLNELSKKNINSAIIYYPEMLRTLQASFNTDFDEQFTRLKRIPILVIDDLGAENMTAWSRDQILGTILQYRMQNHLPTFFTSNHDEKSIREHFVYESSGRSSQVKADRIMDRIKALADFYEIKSVNERHK